jgi:hypothetical protein
MRLAERHLHVVPPCPREREPPQSALDDLGVTAMIFAVALLPIASQIAGIGRWGDGSLGLGTLGVVLAGRELWTWLAASRRSGRPRKVVRSP